MTASCVPTGDRTHDLGCTGYVPTELHWPGLFIYVTNPKNKHKHFYLQKPLHLQNLSEMATVVIDRSFCGLKVHLQQLAPRAAGHSKLQRWEELQMSHHPAFPFSFIFRETQNSASPILVIIFVDTAYQHYKVALPLINSYKAPPISSLKVYRKPIKQTPLSHFLLTRPGLPVFGWG